MPLLAGVALISVSPLCSARSDADDEVPPPIITAEPPPPPAANSVEAPPPPAPATAPAPAPMPTAAQAPISVPPPAAQAEAPAPMPTAVPTSEVTAPAPLGEVPAPPPVTEAPPAEAEEAPPAPEVATKPEKADSFKAREETRAALRGGYAADYQLQRPAWGAQLDFSPSALGKTDLSGGQGVTADGFSVAFEYQPTFLQGLGVFGFGPQISLYPVLPQNTNIQNTPYSVWSYGFNLRYQARFWREQIIVPMAGYDYERLSYNLLNLGNGSMTVAGPVVGIYILMNPLEPEAAYDFYEDSGILRTYLTAEIRSVSGSSSDLSISGTSYYIGIRTEF